MRVVVIGGLGSFGTRICHRLSREPAIEVIATGRHAIKATAAPVSRRAIDLYAPEFAAALSGLRPDVVVHCAGPYQGQDYRVVVAALACGTHYTNLADGGEFVVQFAAHNQTAALCADRVAITGASTLPALSSTVIDHLQERFSHIEEIEIAIAPGQHAPRGRAGHGGPLTGGRSCGECASPLGHAMPRLATCRI